MQTFDEILRRERGVHHADSLFPEVIKEKKSPIFVDDSQIVVDEMLKDACSESMKYSGSGPAPPIGNLDITDYSQDRLTGNRVDILLYQPNKEMKATHCKGGWDNYFSAIGAEKQAMLHFVTDDDLDDWVGN